MPLSLPDRRRRPTNLLSAQPASRCSSAMLLDQQVTIREGVHQPARPWLRRPLAMSTNGPRKTGRLRPRGAGGDLQRPPGPAPLPAGPWPARVQAGCAKHIVDRLRRRPGPGVWAGREDRCRAALGGGCVSLPGVRRRQGPGSSSRLLGKQYGPLRPKGPGARRGPGHFGGEKGSHLARWAEHRSTPSPLVPRWRRLQAEHEAAAKAAGRRPRPPAGSWSRRAHRRGHGPRTGLADAVTLEDPRRPSPKVVVGPPPAPLALRRDRGPALGRLATPAEACPAGGTAPSALVAGRLAVRPPPWPRLRLDRPRQARR